MDEMNTETCFKFYTYDTNGVDMVIPIFAVTEDEAWDKFDNKYGDRYPVDQVLKG